MSVLVDDPWITEGWDNKYRHSQLNAGLCCHGNQATFDIYINDVASVHVSLSVCLSSSSLT